MIRDTIIALVIGLATIIPYDGPAIGALLIAAAAWYLLVGTHEKTRTTP